MRLIAFIMLVAAVKGCSATGDTSSAGRAAEQSVASIARDYKTLRLITPAPVEVNPELAMLCAGASKGQVEVARKNHGVHANAFISIFMNDLAAHVFSTQGKPYPAGAVIVKEKHFAGYRDDNGTWSREGSGQGIGGMVKRAAGFNPGHGDWEYFYFEDPKKIESGRISSCIQCHDQAAAHDHVFGTWAEEHKTK